ncbi:MAG TPA: aspartate--tRNA(Asn) ligase [Patescibacteria group bacterium]|jgi:nondiscriminating aspartyl-tRNA synthetase|nr:aspartate--tRNA(Asn) ligase [Patescibacteria group bacterium]
MRVLASDLKKHMGKPVLLQGWLHKKRLLGGLTFIVLRDRSGLAQILVNEKSEVEKLRGMQAGTVLEISGVATADDRAPGGVEVHKVEIKVMVPVEHESPIEIDKPLSHASDNLDTLFDHRVIGLRNLQETKTFKIRSELTRFIREFLYKNDFVEINTPKLVAGAAEGGAEVFKLDYFGQEATLAQSPQLYKQIMVGVFERVFEIAPAFRAELSATTRHVSEVTMLDIEMGFIKDHNDVMNMVQDMVYNALTRVYAEYGDDLKLLKAPELVLTPEFPRYSMAEIHKMYSKATGKDTSKEIDLTPDEEKWICKYAKENDGSEAVFATNLPKSKMKFYHMANDDGTARSADLLFRGVEISTAPQREHRYENVVKQMEAAGIDPTSPGFSHFLLAFKHGLPPHGGCGFGIDRLTEKVLGFNNIKEAILFPRDINRLTP